MLLDDDEWEIVIARARRCMYLNLNMHEVMHLFIHYMNLWAIHSISSGHTGGEGKLCSYRIIE